MDRTRHPRVIRLSLVHKEGKPSEGIDLAATGNPPSFVRLKPIHSSNDTHRMSLRLL